MTDKPSATEVALASKLVALREEKDRPTVVGGGILGDALTFIGAKGPVLVIRTALIVFIAYFAWIYTSKALQLVSEVTAADAEATRLEVEAAAQTEKVSDESRQAATLRAEYEKLQADADAERVRVEALGKETNGESARLASLRADLFKAKADRDKVVAEVDAQTQITPEGITNAKARAQAQLNKLKLDYVNKVQGVKNAIKAFSDINNDPILGLLK